MTEQRSSSLILPNGHSFSSEKQAKAKTIHQVAHHHLDPLWFWNKSDGEERFRSTTRALLNFMDHYPDFTVAVSSPAMYANLERVSGELFERVVERVKEGRWEPVGGTWVEPDEHVLTGEDYVNSLLLGQEFYAKKFGRIARTAWNPDSFGRDDVVKILKGSGLEFMAFKRPERHQIHLPGDVFWWEGATGERILTTHLHDYGSWGKDLLRKAHRVARDLREPFRDGLLLYGAGNHGGKPTIENMEILAKLHADPSFPRLVGSTPERYFESLQQQELPIPVFSGRLDFADQGGPHTDARLKKQLRRTGSLISQAEAAATARFVEGRRKVYPSSDIRRAKEQLAFNQFHDIAAGTCIPEAYETITSELYEADSIAQRVQREALHALADEIDIPFVEGGQPLVVFNPSGMRRKEFVTINLEGGKDMTQTHMLIDHTGQPLPSQNVLVKNANPNRLGFVAEVGGVGHRVYHVIPKPEGYEEAEEPMSATDQEMENDFFSLHVDEMGRIQLTHKEIGLNVFTEAGCVPTVFKDHGNAWSMEEMGRYTEKLENNVFVPTKIRRTQHGPLMSAITVDYTLQVEGQPSSTTFLQEFRMYKDLPQIDVTARVNWNEKHKALRLAFPVFIRPYPQATSETPYGQTTYSMDGVEQPGLSWTDVVGESDKTPSGEKYWHGLTIANDAKYSYGFTYNQEANKATEYMLVVRGNPYVNMIEGDAPLPGGDTQKYDFHDQGVHEFSYSLLPHLGDWREGGTNRLGEIVTKPLFVMPESAHEGTRPQEESHVQLSHPNIVLGALKKAEGKDGVILRLQEAHGTQTPGVKAVIFGREVELDFRRGEIKTILIPRDPALPFMETNLLEIPLT